MNGSKWMYPIVDGLREAARDGKSLGRWPIIKNGIFGAVDFIGPYLPEIDQSDPYSYRGAFSPPISARCLDAIDNADLVFAWIDDFTKFGSFVELGYAAGLGKRIHIAVYPPLWLDKDFGCGGCDEIWTMMRSADLGCGCSGPMESLRDELWRLGWTVPLESPLEWIFWRAWVTSKMWHPIAPQMSLCEGKVRVDFAHIATKTALEMDGVTYHGSDRSFDSDRSRDRLLAADGWQVVRFSGNQIRRDVDGCVKEAHQIIGRRASPSRWAVR